MAIQFLPMPRPGDGVSSLLDFSPLAASLQNYTRGNDMATQRANMRQVGQTFADQGASAAGKQALSMGELDTGMQLTKQASADKDRQVKVLGAVAKAAKFEQDPQRRAMLWQAGLKRAAVNPQDLDPEELDPMTGPDVFMAAAGMAEDPLDRRLKEAQIQKALRPDNVDTVSINGKLVNKRTGEVIGDYSTPDPIEALLAERFKTMGGSALAPAPSQGVQSVAPQGSATVKPMGYFAPSADQGQQNPLLQLIDNRSATSPPAQGPQPTAPQADLVDTPLGRMPRQEAKSLAGQLMASQKYSQMGKAIWDAATAGTEAPELSTPAGTEIDKATVSAANTLARLSDIQKKFDPKFQEIPNRLKLKGASWGSSLGIPLDPQTTKELERFAEFKAAGFDNFNKLLKEISGTAVSAQELERQQLVQPNPGSGLIDGDDPVTFKSKLEAGQRFARAAIARMNFLRRNNIEFNKDTAEQFLSLDDIPAVIDKRGAEVEEELRQQFPNADKMSIEKQAEQIVRREFGI